MEPQTFASIKEMIENSIKYECKTILKNNFERNEFNKDKVLNWKDKIFKHLEEFLKNKFPEYGFVISIFISKKMLLVLMNIIYHIFNLIDLFLHLSLEIFIQKLEFYLLIKIIYRIN